MRGSPYGLAPMSGLGAATACSSSPDVPGIRISQNAALPFGALRANERCRNVRRYETVRPFVRNILLHIPNPRGRIWRYRPTRPCPLDGGG
jgi:hypothetical protein